MGRAYVLPMFIRALLFLVFSAVPATAAECVVLLHGLARGPNSLLLIDYALTQRGYRVINAGYPSTAADLPELVTHVETAVARCGPGEVDFVTHSMGGLLLRLWAGDNPDRVGRAVMLAPPNKGSEIVDLFGDQAWFAWLNGPAGVRLGTGPDDAPATLPSVTFELGVIAGSGTINPLTSALVEGRDDGKVSVEATKVEGMAAHLTLPVTHTYMMNDPRVIRQVLAFLDDGRFAQDLGWGASLRDLIGR